jgi:hypothetical protein
MDSRQAIAFITQGKWQPVKDFMAQASPETAYELIRLSYEACPMTVDPNGAVSGGGDTVGLTLAGAFHFGIGKRYRGAGGAAQLTEKQYVPYVQHLHESKAALEAALSIDRHYGLAAAFNMAVAIDELEDGQKDMAEAILLDARNVPLSGYLNLLQARLEKWGGSHEDMFRIARSRMLYDVPMQHALIARAHWERYLFYAVFDDSGKGTDTAAVYFNGQQVVDDLDAASSAVLNAKGADPAEQRLAHSWLAFALSEAGKYKQAVRHLDRIKGHDEPSVWLFNNLPPALAKASIRLKAMVS